VNSPISSRWTRPSEGLQEACVSSKLARDTDGKRRRTLGIIVGQSVRTSGHDGRVSFCFSLPLLLGIPLQSLLEVQVPSQVKALD
jgi:hypothetical protein